MQVFFRVIVLNGESRSAQPLTTRSKWQDRLGGGKVNGKFFFRKSSLRSAVCQHFRFPIKDENDETADKMETSYKLRIVLHFKHQPGIDFS